MQRTVIPFFFYYHSYLYLYLSAMFLTNLVSRNIKQTGNINNMTQCDVHTISVACIACISYGCVLLTATADACGRGLGETVVAIPYISAN